MSDIEVKIKIKPFVPASSLLSAYQSIGKPHFDYCSIVWDVISYQHYELQTLQNRAAQIITGAGYRMPISELS